MTFPEGIEACVETWQGTLEHFGINRKVSHWEHTQIVRAIKHFGPEMVELALFGARYEKKTESFDPKDYVSLARILERDRTGRERIDLYANAGARKRKTLASQKRETEQKMVEVERTDPARVREIMKQAFSGMGQKEPQTEQDWERKKNEQLRKLRESESK